MDTVDLQFSNSSPPESLPKGTLYFYLFCLRYSGIYVWDYASMSLKSIPFLINDRNQTALQFHLL